MRPDSESKAPMLTRRRLLHVTSAGGAGLVLAACGADLRPAATTVPTSIPATDDSSATTAAPRVKPDCVLTPEEIEGPFYTDVKIIRRDITEALPGKKLQLRLRVVDADECTPLRDATVDIWHADVDGEYSAFPDQGSDDKVDNSQDRFLRGVQNTDAEGLVVFDTIYPGWYPGRSTHVHVKVHFDNRTQVTTQLFFPDDLSTKVYASSPYNARGQKDTSNDADEFSADQLALRLAVSENDDLLIADRVLGITGRS